MRPEGIEPPAYRFEACRSIRLSYGRVERFYYVWNRVGRRHSSAGLITTSHQVPPAPFPSARRASVR